MGFLKSFRRKPEGLPPWAALDQEALRIGAAMEHVDAHGNLDTFPGGQNEKLALMLTASRQGLVSWNRERQRYELTSLGRERLGLRRALQQQSEPMNLARGGASASGPARRWAMGSGAVAAGMAGLAIGAAAMAFLAGTASKSPPRESATVASEPNRPATRSAGPQTPEQKPAAPREEQASAAPGGGERAPQSEKQQQAVNVPPPAPASTPPAPANPEPPQPAQQAGLHPGAAGAAESALAQQSAAAAKS